ncbi:hypothetical protein BDZ89DRAFT_1094212 [Hymenopellis radicata]|nr:hypothetical protein BDZ89DRAFT_1094212 [Hymenopellis radicata]
MDRTVHPSGFLADFKRHVAENGGTTIFVYRVLRLVGNLVLLGLAITTLILDEIEDGNESVNVTGKWGKKHKKKKARKDWLTKHEWIGAALCMTYFYTSLLALISVTARKQWARMSIRHLHLVLVPTMVVYIYRDVAPLATFTKLPQDLPEGPLLWAKVITLAITAIVIPLFVPREYIPVDPNNPAEVPNAEQITPIISLILYFWMDPVVKAAVKVAHLPYEQLPALADYDTAAHLKSRSFKHLDVFCGAKQRHLFFGLMRIFAKDYMVLVAMLIVQVCADFAAPIGINRLLNYLEVKDKEQVEYRPWLWIAWLFLGPTISSISFDWYIFIATRLLVRCEAIITELVFEHALRIRMKAEAHSTTSTPSTPSEASAPATPGDVTPPDAERATDGSTDTEATLHSPASSEGDTHSRDATLGDSSASVKSTDDSKKEKETTAPVDPEAKNLVGKINNLVTTDLSNIVDSRDFIRLAVYTPVSVIFCVGFLYVILGWSAFVGLAVIIISFPLPGFLTKVVQDVQGATLKKTDGRVQEVTEIVNVMRMIKLFGWERKMDERVAEKREAELVWIKRRQLLDLAVGLINFLIPVLTMMATYATYLVIQTLIMKEELSASKVFSSMTIFNMFSEQLHRLLFTVTQVTAGKVSLDRLTKFLRQTELLDTFSEKDQTPIIPVGGPPKELGLGQATFSWSNDAEVDGSLTPSKRDFMLRIEDELIFRQNCFNLVIGPTGSGKTSLLMALLGEMHFIPSGPGSWYNLPREGGVAYAAQESWVLNATIKENILFGAELDEQRYKKVGEKGLTLSGGQKARITLARAIYSSASIILLDDVLAALDVHTSKWIIEKCFKGDLVKNRTIILVTHNIAMAQPIADFVVSLKDGRIASQGTMSTALAQNKALLKEAREDAEAISRDAEDVNADDEDDEEESEKKSDGKLIVAEEIQEGHLSWASLKLYLSALGGNHVMLFFVGYLGAYMLQELGATLQTWFLGYWASQYDTHDAADVPALKYVFVVLNWLSGLILLVGFSFYIVSFVTYVFGAIRASRTINRKLIESILGSTLRWLDTTPTSRIIARCTQDIRAVDGPVPELLMYLSHMTLSMLFKFSAVIWFTPVFIFPGMAVAFLGYWIGQVYIKAQLSVKREMSNARSPVLAHFGAAISGLSNFINESLTRINKYTRTARTFYNLNRWIDSLAAYLVYTQSENAANIGFSLNMAIGFSSLILWWVRLLNMFEVQGELHLERIQGYLEIEQEEKPTQDASGELRVENLTARYSPDGPKVLHDLSFTIKSGERIGIVGRTGSGKSSLTLSLLRCIYTEGNVFYDGKPTKSLNLDQLRSKITIIPQVPELLSGSLRQNLDPFDQYDDATLNDALRAAGLFSLQSEMEEGRITLDSAISSGGSNLSVGQRQILALARALVRGSKLLILDEDYKTDSIIQTSLRNELKSDMTLITVAHRLQTIMDADKIMVLDAGHIVEFDSPQALLEIPDGKLRSLVDESADKDVLYAMADKKV